MASWEYTGKQDMVVVVVVTVFSELEVFPTLYPQAKTFFPLADEIH